MSEPEILPPARDANNAISKREIELIDSSVENLKGRINLVERIRMGLKSGKKTSEMVLAMQEDVLTAQRDIVQHHAQMIARERKMQITDAYQAGIADLTQRVEDRVANETKYYWGKIYERIEYYEDFFERKIMELKQKVADGTMGAERAQERINQCERDREKQIEHDRVLLEELRDANARVLQRALQDYRPA